jgi:hypothetical protein
MKLTITFYDNARNPVYQAYNKNGLCGYSSWSAEEVLSKLDSDIRSKGHMSLIWGTEYSDLLMEEEEQEDE